MLRKRLMKLVAAAALGTAVIVVGAGMASAQSFSGTVGGTGGDGLFVRPTPSQSGTPLATLADGTTVTFDCYAVGDVVAGYYSTDGTWQHLVSGGYVSDTYIYTGYNGPVPGEPECPGAVPSPPPPPPAKPWVSKCNTVWTNSVTWVDGAWGGLTYQISPKRLTRVVGLPAAGNLLTDLLHKCLPSQAKGVFDYEGVTVNSLRAQIQCHLIFAVNKPTYNIDSVSTSQNLVQAIHRRCQ